MQYDPCLVFFILASVFSRERSYPGIARRLESSSFTIENTIVIDINDHREGTRNANRNKQTLMSGTWLNQICSGKRGKGKGKDLVLTPASCFHTYYYWSISLWVQWNLFPSQRCRCLKAKDLLMRDLKCLGFFCLCSFLKWTHEYLLFIYSACLYFVIWHSRQLQCKINRIQ